MRDLLVLFIHLLATLVRLLGPGGVRSLLAESLLLKHQLLIVNRSRQRSPNLSASDRILAGLLALLVRATRLLRSANTLKPSTLLGLHKALSKQKYRMLFSTNRRRKPGPKGASVDLIHAVVEMKQRNPNWGCPRIAQQIALAFHISIDKDVVRRILAHHYRPGPVIVLNEEHLKYLLKEFIEEYYHLARPHQGLNGDTPVPSAKPESAADVSRLVSIPVVGGLHHRYMRVAA